MVGVVEVDSPGGINPGESGWTGGRTFTQMGFCGWRWVGYPARHGRSADLDAVDGSRCRG